MKFFAALVSICFSVSAMAAQNPFNQFLGEYDVQASACEVDGRPVTKGCGLVGITAKAVDNSIQIYEEEQDVYAVYPMVAFKTVTKAGVTQADFSGANNVARWTKTQEVYGQNGAVVSQVLEERSIVRDASGITYQVTRMSKAQGVPSKAASKTYLIQLKQN